MTLCAAAACMHKEEPRLVIVADKLLSNEVMSAEIAVKFEEVLAAILLAMYSGPPAQALDLIDDCKRNLKWPAVFAEELPDLLAF